MLKKCSEVRSLKGIASCTVQRHRLRSAPTARLLLLLGDESLFNLYTIPTMKKYLLHFFFLTFALLSLCGCDNLKYAELYEITDEFVEELHTDVESYGCWEEWMTLNSPSGEENRERELLAVRRFLFAMRLLFRLLCPAGER